jgi:hypothetical protein
MDSDFLSQRLRESGPKRILALDGGGLRGLITIGYLARIESIIRSRHQRPGMVLSDYFDLIGGTSSGAIISALLALGWPVAKIREEYLKLGCEAFQPRRSWLGPLGRFLGPRFDERPLEALLKEHMGDRTLDSADLRVGLAIIIKRADTGSVWVVLNVPGHRFYEMNRKMHLWEIVRSSTAAPTFFRPSLVSDVGEGEGALFVDGGVSMHNNPALQLLMVATLEGYALKWPIGENHLLLCSLGAGEHNWLADKESLEKFSNIHWLATLVIQLMKDASELNQTILQWMSKSPTARLIDRQIGALEGDHLVNPPLLSYLRYNVDLEQASLKEFGLEFSFDEVEALMDMCEVKNISQLDRIGSLAANAQVREEHFPRAFDRVIKG